MSFLNKKQIEKLKGFKWEVRPDGFFLKLRPEDFRKHHDWAEIVEATGTDPDAIEIELLIFGVANNYEEDK